MYFFRYMLISIYINLNKHYFNIYIFISIYITSIHVNLKVFHFYMFLKNNDIHIGEGGPISRRKLRQIL